ncbi:centrosomal protein of 89 kDa-like [Lycorma delicatula]|uniref:centrosomal protein of 89 kDa-like n=1 Tax=Lycorma delicatula TaxID=130591 RepID=UPI003F510C3E
MAAEVPDSDHDQSLLITGVNATKYCSLRRQEKRERRARRQGSHKVQQQLLQHQQTKAVVHSQIGQVSGNIPLPDASLQCRHSVKHSRRWLMTELDRIKQENEILKTGEGELQTKLSQVENEKEQLLGDVEGLSTIREENKQLQQDVFMLKNLVIRLNVELEHMQDKLYSIKYTGINITSAADEPITKEKPVRASSWGRSEMNVVAPLLQAYQETLEDRDQLISNYRKEMEHFTARCKTIVAENENLHHQLIEANKKGEVTYTEWQSVQMEAAMTRDQNELLMRQSKLNQNKLNDLHSAYQSRINDLTVDRDEVQERLSKTQAELFVLRGRCSVLTEECDRLKSDINQKIPVSVHKAAVDECKRLFEELKHRYENEHDNLIRKIASLEAGRPDIDIQLINTAAERDQLVAESKAADKMSKKLEEKISELEDRLHQSEKGRESCKRQLTQTMAFARELITEQESLVNQLDERRSVVKLGSDIAVRVGQLRNRLKGVERDACKEIDGMEQKFKQQASSLDRMKAHFSQEINRMKALLKEKDTLIQQLKLEKSKAEEQLEVVWQAAVNDKINIKENAEVE